MDTGLCAMHVCEDLSNNGKLSALTQKRFQTFLEFTSHWISLTKEPEKTVALKNKAYLGKTLHELGLILYHSSCYKRYTDLTQIKSAKENMEKEESDEATRPKRLRSSVSLTPAASPRLNIMPSICIICQKDHKWIRSRGTRVRDRFSQAETNTAGTLLYAAEQKQDENILLHIRGRDCVAMGVKYHRSCYKDYTRGFERMPSLLSDVEETEITHEASFSKSQSSIGSTGSGSIEDLRIATAAVSENTELHHVGLAIQRAILRQPACNVSWPPLAGNINLDECAKLVPFQLFNAVALILNVTKEIPPPSGFLEVSNEARQKILSICMDMVCLNSGGRRQNPKS